MPEEQSVVPKEIRRAAAVIVVEAVGLLVGAGVLIVKTVTGHPDNIWRGLLDAAFALGGALILVLAARGIYRLQPAARTPILIIQLLALPVSYDLTFQAGLVGYGGPILIAALSVLYLLFTPAARIALDRAPD